MAKTGGKRAERREREDRRGEETRFPRQTPSVSHSPDTIPPSHKSSANCAGACAARHRALYKATSDQAGGRADSSAERAAFVVSRSTLTAHIAAEWATTQSAVCWVALLPAPDTADPARREVSHARCLEPRPVDWSPVAAKPAVWEPSGGQTSYLETQWRSGQLSVAQWWPGPLS